MADLERIGKTHQPLYSRDSVDVRSCGSQLFNHRVKLPMGPPSLMIGCFPYEWAEQREGLFVDLNCSCRGTNRRNLIKTSFAHTVRSSCNKIQTGFDVDEPLRLVYDFALFVFLAGDRIGMCKPCVDQVSNRTSIVCFCNRKDRNDGNERNAGGATVGGTRSTSSTAGACSTSGARSNCLRGTKTLPCSDASYYRISAPQACPIRRRARLRREAPRPPG